jgi:hypothetical protein
MITTVKHKILLLLGTLALLVSVLYLYHWANDFKPTVYGEGDFGYKLGFFNGLTDGLVSVCSLISNLFADTTVYAASNSGVFYNLGFAMGIGFWLYTVFSVFYIDNQRVSEYTDNQQNEAS